MFVSIMLIKAKMTQYSVEFSHNVLSAVHEAVGGG
jgi:hypothetical protein